MSLLTSQEVLSQCLTEDGVLNTKLKSEQEVLNLVYDDTEKALNVAISGLTATNLTNLLTLLANQATVTTLKVCVSMADNAIINLPACPNGGFLKICTSAGQCKFFIPSTGIPEYESYYSSVFALASTAGRIGIFQVAGQSYACIENKTGGAVVVTYKLEYGVVA